MRKCTRIVCNRDLGVCDAYLKDANVQVSVC